MLNLFTICLHENITRTCFSSCDRKETGAWNFRTWSSSPWLAWTWHLMWLREARAAGVCHPIGLHGDDLMDSGGTLRTTSMTCMLCAIIMAPCKGGTTQVCSARDRCLCGRFLQACLLVTGSLCLKILTVLYGGQCANCWGQFSSFGSLSKSKQVKLLPSFSELDHQWRSGLLGSGVYR